MIKKLFTHTAIYGAAPYVPKIASFFVLPIVTQYLTPADYGVYGVVTSTTGAISVFGSLGLRIALVNSYYKSSGHYKWLWRQVYGFLSLWVIPYSLLSCLFIYLLLPPEAMVNAWKIVLLTVTPGLFFANTATIASTYYQVNKKPMPVAIRTALFGSCTVLLNLYMIAYLEMGYMGWFLSTFITSVANSISYWIPLNFQMAIKPIFNFKWRLIKKCLSLSLPTIPHYYSGYLLNASDKFVMQSVGVTTDDIGRYSVSYMFGNYFNNLGTAIGLAIGPIMNEAFKKGQELKVRNLVFFTQALFLILSFLVAIWLKELFAFFIRNDSLNQLFGLGVIIVMAYNYRPMYLGAAGRLFYAEKTKVLWIVSFVSGAINVVLNLILVPLVGFEMAAVTTFVALMYMGYVGYFMPDFRKNTRVNYHPLFWLSCTVLLTLIAYYIVDWGIYQKALISILMLPIAALVLFRIRRMIHEKS